MSVTMSLVGAFLAAVALAALHLAAPRIRALPLVPEKRMASFAGGLAVSYVFLHLLPEIASNEGVGRLWTTSSSRRRSPSWPSSGWRSWGSSPSTGWSGSPPPGRAPRRRARGRLLLAGSLLLGWAISAVAAPTSTLTVSVLTALLGGAILPHVVKEEIPSERQGSFTWFLTGVTFYAVLLGVITALE